MSSINVLIIGGGGREHALAWKLAQSKKIGKLYAAPGNPGIAELGKCVNVDVANNQAVLGFAKENKIDLVVVGPEQPLVDGLGDVLTENEIAVFGPSQAAAKIESSKAFSKDLMQELGVPTAKYKNFTDYEAAQAYLKEQGAPIVIKASGLAEGKGVTVCQTMKDAEAALKETMQDKRFGEAGAEVVIEEFMAGPEVSIHAFSDGEDYLILPPSQDNKAINDGGKGPNTGGMGTVSPLAGVSEALMKRIEQEIVQPIITAMNQRGTPYVGLLYPGLIITEEGPKVVEFNCRFGDPEVEAYMATLESDLLEIMLACVNGALKDQELSMNDRTAVNVVLASGGYPLSYKKGFEITGITEAEADEAVTVFQAGTKIEDDKLLTNGGRVLDVTAVGKDLDDARGKVYQAIKKINFEGMQFRSDIGVAHDNAKLKNH